VTGTVDVVVELGDASNDNNVNIFDLVAVRNALNTVTTSSTARRDITVDGNINIFDLVAVRNNLGQ